MSANLLAAVRIANDLLMAAQAVQAVVNGAAIAGRDVTMVELDQVHRLARTAGVDLDKAIADAIARHQRIPPPSVGGLLKD